MGGFILRGARDVSIFIATNAKVVAMAANALIAVLQSNRMQGLVDKLRVTNALLNIAKMGFRLGIL